jgi:hypothetical protein
MNKSYPDQHEKIVPSGYEREKPYAINKKLNEREINRIAANTRATLEMEGLSPSKESEEIGKKYLRGEISEHEAKKLILKIHGIG